MYTCNQQVLLTVFDAFREKIMNTNRHSAVNPAADSGEEVNLTPMLDVVFIMLIFFIVTASFLREHAVDVYTPPAGVKSDANVDSITVHVLNTHGYTVNGRAVSRSGLSPYLHQLNAEYPEASFAILVQNASEVKDLVFAVDAARRLGVSPVPVASLKK